MCAHEEARPAGLFGDGQRDGREVGNAGGVPFIDANASNSILRQLRPTVAERILPAWLLDERPELCGTWHGIGYKTAAYLLSMDENAGDLGALLTEALHNGGEAIVMDGRALVIGGRLATVSTDRTLWLREVTARE